jgi:hypothetical protein
MRKITGIAFQRNADQYSDNAQRENASDDREIH